MGRLSSWNSAWVGAFGDVLLLDLGGSYIGVCFIVVC